MDFKSWEQFWNCPLLQTVWIKIFHNPRLVKILLMVYFYLKFHSWICNFHLYAFKFGHVYLWGSMLSSVFRYILTLPVMCLPFKQNNGDAKMCTEASCRRHLPSLGGHYWGNVISWPENFSNSPPPCSPIYCCDWRFLSWPNSAPLVLSASSHFVLPHPRIVYHVRAPTLSESPSFSPR